jgi:energy-converting hydrogenase Eha subunit E
MWKKESAQSIAAAIGLVAFILVVGSRSLTLYQKIGVGIGVFLVFNAIFFIINFIASSDLAKSILAKAAITVGGGVIGSVALSALGIEGGALAMGTGASVVLSLISINIY